MTTTAQLTDALRQWRIARSADDELRWYVAGQAMAAAIDEFLRDAAEADRLAAADTARQMYLQRNLNPSSTLLKNLERRYCREERPDWSGL